MGSISLSNSDVRRNEKFLGNALNKVKNENLSDDELEVLVRKAAIAAHKLDKNADDDDDGTSSFPFSLSNDDDDSSSSSSYSTTELRKGARAAKRVERAINAQVAGELPVANSGPARASFQAKFCCGESSDDYGPAVLIVKNSLKQVIEDSFDGDTNGILDVFDGYRNFANQAGVNQSPDVFLQQVRNRATVNGGSIALRALVVTGFNPQGNYAMFDNDKILISPCFPVVYEADYNVEMYLGTPTADLDNGLVQVRHPNCNDNVGAFINGCAEENTPHVPGSSFWDLVNGDVVFKEETESFALEFPNDHVKRASVKFEQCSQFSYFA